MEYLLLILLFNYYYYYAGATSMAERLSLRKHYRERLGDD